MTGLLRKRAKKYTEAEASSDEDTNAKGPKRRKVRKETLSEAFKFIMNKEIEEKPFDEAGYAEPIKDTMLSKYKKRARVIEEEKKEEDANAKKRLVKEQQRLMGRVIPTKVDNEHEREL